MQLTPMSEPDIRAAITALHAGLAGQPRAQTVLARIAAATPDCPKGDADARHRVCTLIDRFGIAQIDGAPQDAFSWDGRAIRTRSEPCVVVHELAHWQLCPADRLTLPDFGLGAGPETGRRDDADAACRVTRDTQIAEELHASLLGILWEVALGIGGRASFAEQNWLEGAARPGTAALLANTLAHLAAVGLIDPVTAAPVVGTSIRCQAAAASA